MKTFLAVPFLLMLWAITGSADEKKGEKTVNTVVSIKGMHCVSCAKKVTKKLQAVTNAKTVKTDAEKGEALIVAVEGKSISPKSIWEAVEATGYKPTELKGPDGTFKTKPTK